MARTPRGFVSGCAYHVTQRGNHKKDIFRDDTDRLVYLKLLAVQSRLHKLRIWAYTLMSNHVHHVVVPDTDRALSDAFRGVFGAYARYFNTRHGVVGHLFQGRFRAPVLDDAHLWNAVAYVERNPVRASMVSRAEDFPWSSASAHCGLRPDPLLSPDLPILELVRDWSAWLAKEERPEDLAFIREKTRLGRPCADDEFVRTLEMKLGRKLLPQKAGRKKNVPPDQSPSLWKLGNE